MESLAAMPSIKRKRAESEAIPNNTTPLKSHKNNQSDIATSKQTVPTQLRPSAINMGKGCSLDQKTQPKEIQKQSFLDEIHEKGRRKTDTPPEFRSIK